MTSSREELIRRAIAQVVIIFCYMLGDRFKRAGDDQSAAAHDRGLALADRLRARDPRPAGGWLSSFECLLASYAEWVGRRGDRTWAAAVEKRSIEVAHAQAALLYAALGEMHVSEGRARITGISFRYIAFPYGRWSTPHLATMRFRPSV